MRHSKSVESQRFSQKFPRSVRLTMPEEFSRALKQRGAVRNSRFALHLVEILAAPDESALGPDGQLCNGHQWRLGLVVPKRYEASAVRRNAIKRIWRESFRCQRVFLESLPARDLVVRLLGPVILDAKSRKSLAILKQQCHADAELLMQQILVKLQTK